MKISALFLGTLLLAGCGYGGDNGNGDGNGNCPDMTGTWVVTAHCEPSVVGTTSTVTQDGCDITADWGGVIFTGTVDGNGNTTITQDPLEGNMVCTGGVTGNTWTVDCTPDGCHVVSQKQ
jgi:hypothetical protein